MKRRKLKIRRPQRKKTSKLDGEGIRILWLLHWNLATNIENPLLAWNYLLNRWQDPELVPSVVLRALEKEAMKENDGISPVTLEQHLDTFLHTYVPTRGRKGEVL